MFNRRNFILKEQEMATGSDRQNEKGFRPSAKMLQGKYSVKDDEFLTRTVRTTRVAMYQKRAQEGQPLFVDPTNTG